MGVTRHYKPASSIDIKEKGSDGWASLQLIKILPSYFLEEVWAIFSIQAQYNYLILSILINIEYLLISELSEDWSNYA